RLLALPIALQNSLFAVFEELLASRIESAIAAGSYDVGVETLTADSLRITDRRTIHTHAATGAETRLFKVLRRDRNRPLPAGDALALARDPRARLLVNDQSGRAAVQMPAPSLTLDDGEVQRRVRLVRPMARETIALDAIERSHWENAGAEPFAATWNAEVAQVPEFTESAFHIVTGLLL
ncbi:strawberry notch C-terminal domain-containing protein, partial [Acidiphilium sp.]|uniref:strawberry notch C-terminal domain-containing protein n=1 Tax=Acidiphilium sp. TaxID=527 RepID=UPI003D057450